MNLARPTTLLVLALAAGNVSVTWAEEDAPPPQSKAGQFGDYKPQDFLSDYSRIKPVGDDSDAYRYRNPAVDAKKYSKLMIDR